MHIAQSNRSPRLFCKQSRGLSLSSCAVRRQSVGVVCGAGRQEDSVYWEFSGSSVVVSFCSYIDDLYNT